MQTNMNRDWLLTKANEEANGFISVGGLVCRVMTGEARGSEDIPGTALRVSLSHKEDALREYVEIGRLAADTDSASQLGSVTRGAEI